MKLEVNIEKKYAFGILAGILIILGAFFVMSYDNIPNPGHGGDEIQVTVASGEKDLQSAIDNDLCQENGDNCPGEAGVGKYDTGWFDTRSLNCLLTNLNGNTNCIFNGLEVGDYAYRDTDVFDGWNSQSDKFQYSIYFRAVPATANMNYASTNITSARLHIWNNRGTKLGSRVLDCYPYSGTNLQNPLFACLDIEYYDFDGNGVTYGDPYVAETNMRIVVEYYN